jgi:signal transduction histidine kinase
MSPEPTAIGELIDDLVLLASPMATDCKVSLNHIKNKLSHRSIMADRTRLRQVLLNLISNAIKHNKIDGEVKITLEKATKN